MSFGTPFVEIIRQVCPQDMKYRNLYVLSDLDVEGGSSLYRHWKGWTGNCVDELFRTHLEATGEWAGRGWAMVLRESHFMDSPEPGKFWSLLDIALHELSHLMTYEDDLEPVTADERNSILVGYYLDIAKHNLRSQDEHRQQGRVVVRGHGPDFIRAGLHVCHRAVQAGHLTTPSMMLLDQGEGWAELGRWAAALGDEPEQRSHESIREILKSPAPEAFQQLAASEELRLSRQEKTNA